MATTKLYLDKRNLDASGRGILRLVLNHRNTSTSQSLNIKLRPDEWDDAHSQCKSRARNLDAMIQKKKSDVDMVLFRMETEGKALPATASEIMLHVRQVLEPEKYQQKGPLFVDIYRKVMNSKEANTLGCYQCALSKMEAFDTALGERTFDDLDVDWFKRFMKFMGENMSWNGQRNYLRSIRHVFNYALDERITTNYPFKRLDMSAAPTRKRCLSLEQMRMLRTMEVSPWQEEYRDMFLLMFYLIGINAVDLFTAKPDQIINGRLEYVRTKTRSSSKEQYSIKLEPEALALIDKYRGKNWLVSPMDHYTDYASYLQHMNKALGTLGMEYISGKKPEGSPLFPGLTSYWARHTWSTLAYEQGYSVDLIGQALGHVDGKHAVTMIYIKPDQRKVDEANRAIIDAIQ